MRRLSDWNLPGLFVLLLIGFVGFYASSLAYKAQGEIATCPAGQDGYNAIAALLTAGVVAATLASLWVLEEMDLAKYLNPTEGGFYMGCAIVLTIGILFTTNGSIIVKEATDGPECEEVKSAGKSVQIPGICLLVLTVLYFLVSVYNKHKSKS